MSKGKIKLGETINLEEKLSRLPRRKFMSSALKTVAGILTFSEFIESVYGKSVEGKPLVRTRGKNGDPKEVKMISKMRHNRLKHYYNIDMSDLYDSIPELYEISLEQDSSEVADFVYKVYVSEIRGHTRTRFRKYARGIPFEVIETDIEYSSSCSSRHNATNNMRGGLSVGPSSYSTGYGTLGLPARYSDGSRCLITAQHVMEDSYNMYQPEGTSNRVGTFLEGSPPDFTLENRGTGMDSTSYKVDWGNVSSANIGTQIDNTNITGLWTFEGLTDQINSGGIPVPVDCYLSGATSCQTGGSVVETNRGGRCAYRADFANQVTQNGDSGGAFVDYGGNLVCLASGYKNGDAVGGVGYEALDAVGASL